MKYERWQIAAENEAASALLQNAGYPALLASVLSARGIADAEGAAEFLDREQTLAYSPLLLRDMDKAVSRITDALQNGEKIAVFGDYDVDGITSTVLLTDYLRSRGGDVVFHIPRRIEEGYGLGRDAIRSLADAGVTLIVTVDCGITGAAETAFAASLGVDVVITDHHECKETLPAAAAVVDPHRPDCPYPFKQLAGVGVALKLALALGGKHREDAIFARYCTLAAIGTVADVMRMSGENRAIVQRGLDAISHSDLVGLHALLREAGLAGKPLTSIQIGFILAPRLNAAGRMGKAELAAELLLTQDAARAEEMARALCDLNRERQTVEQEIFADAVSQIAALPQEERSALVLASPAWHQGVVGIVASRLCEKYACPSFMIHLSGGTGKGSCRSYGGLNLFAALESCSDLLLGFGGHELAAGFTIEEANIPAFRKRINQYVRAHTADGAPVSCLNIDAEVREPEQLTLAEVEALSQLEPYGAGNERPVFCLRGATLDDAQGAGQNKHLKVRLQKNRVPLNGIFFSVSPETLPFTPPCRVDAAFHLQVNEFRGVRSVQLQLIDLRAAVDPSAREKECIDLCRAMQRGEDVPVRDAARALPSREQFVRAWRTLEHIVPPQGLCEPTFPLLRRLAAGMVGNDSFLRALSCLAVFEEQKLLSLSEQDGMLTLRLTAEGKKVDLEQSAVLRALRRAAEGRKEEPQ